MNKLYLLLFLFPAAFALSGCATNNTLPEPRFTMYGYTTDDGYIYVIEPKSGKSLVVKSVFTTNH